MTPHGSLRLESLLRLRRGRVRPGFANFSVKRWNSVSTWVSPTSIAWVRITR
ncbi:MAG: hypothetical protein QOG64_2733, partial [Acidimicrobiaceae bacterium]|nr:hypothetical protein [Acidimicrobiaceae bacterium]